MPIFNGLSVLLLEDEYLIALDAEQILKDLGVARLEIVSTLAEASQSAEAGAFDLVILDVNINGEMSFPLAKRLASRGIPVVFATGYEWRQSRPGQFEQGVYLSKPYTAESLKDAILTALRGSLATAGAHEGDGRSSKA